MKGRITVFLLICGVLAAIGAAAESRWVLCKSYVNVRIGPGKTSEVVGRLDAGDEFETDGTRRNGFLRVLGIGENGNGWVYAGYTSTEKPEQVNERYVCVARKRVACRRWTKGPRISGKTGWLYNGSNVTVYWKTEKWCVTNRGYIAAAWLEADPE